MGITFYGMFASGDLQDWAEPTLEEQKAWDPVNSGIMKETTFVRILNNQAYMIVFSNNIFYRMILML